MKNIILKKCYNLFGLMRVNQPIGLLLLLYPTIWALLLSNIKLSDYSFFIIFILGAFFMRSAGCVFNDYIDLKIDKYVQRTKNRPLPSGNVNHKEAKLLFIFLIGIAFLLVLMLNIETIFLSIGALILTCIYPFTKRYTNFAQVILGIAFSWPILMVYMSTQESLPIICWLLFTANVIWTVIYDTQYAMLDKDDDIRIGVKSTAVLFKHFNVLIIILLQFITLILLILIGWYMSFNIIYYFTLLGVIMLFIWQNIWINKQDKQNYLKAFLYNKYIGLLITIGIILGLHIS